MVFCGWTPKTTGEREKGEVGGGGESAWGREGNEVKVMKGRGKRKERKREGMRAERGKEGEKEAREEGRERGEGERGVGRRDKRLSTCISLKDILMDVPPY